jgi:hypothetical protein
LIFLMQYLSSLHPDIPCLFASVPIRLMALAQ